MTVGGSEGIGRSKRDNHTFSRHLSLHVHPSTSAFFPVRSCGSVLAKLPSCPTARNA